MAAIKEINLGYVGGLKGESGKDFVEPTFVLDEETGHLLMYVEEPEDLENQETE